MNRNRNRRRATFGAAAVLATLLTSGVGVGPALAAGDHGAQAGHSAGKDSKDSKSKGKGHKGGKSDAARLAKAVDKVDAALERLSARAEKKLGAETSARVVANIAADRASLAELTSIEDVRALKPENYDRVVAWLRKADRLVGSVEAPDPDITAAATALADQLFTISASSGRADLEVAKDLVHALRDLVLASLEADPEAETPETPETPEAETPEAPEAPEAETPEAPEDESGEGGDSGHGDH